MIEFQSSEGKVTSTGAGQFRAEISGELSLHGVIRPQTLVARVSISGERLRASGGFSIYQTEYGIQLVTVAGGALKVKDELKASFEIIRLGVDGAYCSRTIDLCRGQAQSADELRLHYGPDFLPNPNTMFTF